MELKIVTDVDVLKQRSIETDLEYVKKEKIFEKLGIALMQSAIPGVGLSAIQIGYPVRVAVVQYEDLDLKLINPRILEQENPVVFYNEACLSLPGTKVNTDRFEQITVEWTNEENKVQKAIFRGLEAIILQHEIDHMNGILIIDRKLKPYFRQGRKIGRNEKCPCGSDKKYKKCCGK